MGTCWSVAFAENPPRHAEGEARSADGGGDRLDAVRAAIEARLAQLIADLSHWEPMSALSRFNRAPAGSWHPLSIDFANVVTTAIDLAAISERAFDPTIGRIVDLFGFGPPGPQPDPDPDALAAALARSGADRLAYDAQARRLRQPGGLALDFSGIAKGYAVDAIGAVLDSHGIADWLVEIGGELKGRGMRPDADPWWVDLETPPGLAVAPLRIALHGLAVATSGDSVRGLHTIDPRTGRAIANHVRSVSVLHRSAMLADAWATALTVLGPHDGMALAARHDIAAVMRVGGATPSERVSPALQRMLDD